MYYLSVKKLVFILSMLLIFLNFVPALIVHAVAEEVILEEPISSTHVSWPVGSKVTATSKTGTSISLNWTAAEGDVSFYTIYNDETDSSIGISETLSYKITNLDPETEYSFRIEASNALEIATTDGPSATVMTTGIVTPSWSDGAVLSASETTVNSITLNWGPADGDVYAYRIYDEATGRDVTQTSSTSYTVDYLYTGGEEGAPLSPDTEYTFSVKARDKNFIYSEKLIATLKTAQDNTPPDWHVYGDPTIYINTEGTSFAEIGWSPVTDNSQGSLTYYVYIDNRTITATDRNVRIEGLELDTTYNVRVEASDGSGNVTVDGPTATITTGQMSAPENLNINSVTNSQVRLGWKSMSGIELYRIYRNGNELTTNADNIFTDTGLSSFTNYEYQVVAEDANGNQSQAAGITVTTKMKPSVIRASVTSNGEELSESSGDIDYSQNGRYIALKSNESVYVHDLLTGERQLVSIFGNGYTSGHSPSISADGKHVVFQAGTDKNSSIFVRDIVKNKTTEITSWGTEYFADYYSPSISADGRFITFNSNDSFTQEDSNDLLDVYIYDRDADGNGIFDEDADVNNDNQLDENGAAAYMLVTKSADGNASDGESLNPEISADGNYVVFESSATNLVSSDTNGATDIFRYYATDGTIESVSMADDGGSADGSSEYPSISADGQYVAFASKASNLTSDSSSGQQIYVRDMNSMTAGKTDLVSLGQYGNPGNGDSFTPSINEDGRFISYVSASTNLVMYDQNLKNDVFVYDRQTQTLNRVNVGPDGEESNTSLTYTPSIRGDGLAVAFYSRATNLLPYQDQNNAADVFVAYYASDLDREDPTWTEDSILTSKNIGPSQITLMWPSAADNEQIKYYKIYQNGSIVGSTHADKQYTVTGLSPETTYSFKVKAIDTKGNLSSDGPEKERSTILYMDAPNNVKYKSYAEGIALYWDAPTNAQADELSYTISRDGQEVRSTLTHTRFLDGSLTPETSYMYEITASDKNGNTSHSASIAGITNSSGQGISTTRISEVDGTGGNRNSDDPFISGDGKYIAFTTYADNLSYGTSKYHYNIYLYDKENESLARISQSYDGSEINGNSKNAAVNRDGNIIAFDSTASNLKADDENNVQDIFVYNRTKDSIEKVSVSSSGAASTAKSFQPSVSGNGRYISFLSEDTSLAAGNDNSGMADLYLRDLETGETVLISDGTEEYDHYDVGNDTGEVMDPKMSYDGRFVTFSIKFKGTNLRDDITQSYVYDRDSDHNGTFDEPANKKLEMVPYIFGSQNTPDISDDGRYVSYVGQYVHVYDRTTGNTETVSVDLYGNKKNQGYDIEMNSDGRYVVYVSGFDWLTGDTNGDRDIYLYDREEDFTYLISTSSIGEPSDGDSRAPSISDNGQDIVYHSYGTTLVTGDESGWQDIFMTTIDAQGPEWLPNSLSVKNVGQTVLTLEWTAAQDDQDIKNYRIYTDDQLTDTVPGTQLSYNISGLNPESTYTFRIEAGDSNGNWSNNGPSQTVTTVSGAAGEAALTATARSGGFVDLAWDTALDSGFTGYLIYRENPEGDIETIDINSAETGVYTDSGLKSNTAYTYQVFGVNGLGGEVSHTVEVSVTTTELTAGNLTWDIARVGIPSMAVFGEDLTIEVTTEQDRDVFAVLAYLSWYDEDQNMLNEPIEKTTDITLTESTSDSGLYNGTYSLIPGISHLVSLTPVTSDGYANEVEGAVKLIGLNVSPGVNIQIGTTASSNVLNQSKLFVWSDELQKGSSMELNDIGNYEWYTLAAADDYEFKIYNSQLGEILAKHSGQQLKYGMRHELALTADVPASLRVQAMDHEGNALSDISVNVWDQNNEFLGSDRTNTKWLYPANDGLLSGDIIKLAFEGMKWPYVSEYEEIFTLEPDVNVIQVHIPFSESGTIQGQVTDQEGNPVTGVNISTTQDHQTNEWEKINNRTTTDENGKYKINVLPGEVKIVGAVPNDRYQYTRTQILTVAKDQTEIINLQLEELQEAKVWVTLRTQYIGDPKWQVLEPEQMDGTTLYHYHATIESPHDSNFRGSHPMKVRAVPGDEVTVCFKGHEAHLPDGCSEAILDSNAEANVTIELAQTGGFIEGIVTDSETGNVVKELYAILYSVNENDERSHVRSERINDDSGQLRVWVPEAGNYVMEVRKNGHPSRVSQVEFQMEEGQTLQQNISLYPFGFFAGREGNVVSASNHEAIPGTDLGFRVSYHNQGNQTVQNAVIRIPVESGTSLVQESLLFNGSQISQEMMEITNAGFNVEVGEIAPGESGVIRYAVQIDLNFSGEALGTTALISYSSNDRPKEEVLGIAEVSMELVTLKAPFHIVNSEMAVTVQGRAPVGSTVQIFDGQVILGEVNASPVGYWKLDTYLSGTKEKGYHELRAVALLSNGSKFSTKRHSVLYDPNIPHIQEISMQQTSGRKVTFEAGTSTARFPYVVRPSDPFMFTIKFNQPEKIDHVSVRMGPESNGHIAEASLGDNELFEAKVNVRGFPEGKIFVDYDIKIEDEYSISNDEILQGLPQWMQEINPASPIPTINEDEDLSNIEPYMKGTYDLNGVSTEIERRLVEVEIEDTQQPIEIFMVNDQQIEVFDYSLGSLHSGDQMKLRMSMVVSEEDARFLHLDSTTVTEKDPFSVKIAGKSKKVKDILEGAQNAEDIKDAWDQTDPSDEFIKAKAEWRRMRSEIPKICKPWLRKVAREHVTNQWYDNILRPEIMRNAASLFFPDVVSDFWEETFREVQIKTINATTARVDAWVARNQDCDGDGEPDYIPDPSGFVYEVTENNRIEGVTATALHRTDENEAWKVWDAEWYMQQNPMPTDPEGKYGWFVPYGEWKVSFNKEGYETTSSIPYYGVLPVPPEQFNIDVPMVTKEAPDVSEVKALAGEGIYITFDQYIQTNTVTSATYGIYDADGDLINGALSIVGTVTDTDGDKVATALNFTPEEALTAGQQIEVTLDELIQNYAGIPLGENYHITISVQDPPQNPDDDEDSGEEEDEPPLETKRHGKAFDTDQDQTLSFNELGITVELPSGLIESFDVSEAEEWRLEVKKGGIEPGDEEWSNIISSLQSLNRYRSFGIFLDINLTAFLSNNEEKKVHGLLDQPITMTIDLNQYEDVEIVHPEKIGLFLYDEQVEDWMYKPGIYDKQKGTLTIQIDHLSKFSILETNVAFSDLNAHWAEADVEILAGRQYINGRDIHTFDPEAQITRAEFVALLARMLDLTIQLSDKMAFQDVSQNAWYYEEVMAVYQAGLVQGISVTEFAPNDPVTREQIVALVSRALEMQGFNTELQSVKVRSLLEPFSDVSDISLWAEENMAYAIQQGILKGRTQSTLVPEDTATRAEAAVILKRFLDLWWMERFQQ